MARDRTRQMIQAQVDVRMPDEIDLIEFRGWFDAEAEEIADYILKEAKGSTAFDDVTGTLRKSMSKRKVKDGEDEYWVVQARAPHAHLVEFGHVLTDKDGTQIGHVPGRPFLVPAKEKGIAEAVRRFSAR